MSERSNEIRIGGDVAGNFVVGDHNTVGSPAGVSVGPVGVCRVFVSYRIDDSVYATAAIAERLALAFGAGNVFRDRDSLALGAVYPERIRRAVERADVVVAVVGPAWLDIVDGGGRRLLDDPRDWVRTELRMAFERGIPVVPVLLDGTDLPEVGRLPRDIVDLAVSTYWRVRHQSFESDVRGLVDGLRQGR